LKYIHFPLVFMMSMASVTVPYVWPILSMWLEYPELPLLLRMAKRCSLYLVLKARLVCTVYFNGQYKHFIW
jgi:hypothetical protein